MKFFRALLLVAAFFPLFAKAQTNFKPGYVVTLKGDTVKGSVDYKEWNKTPIEIRFKPDNSNTVTNYAPANVLAFGVTNNVHYRSFLVPISKSEETFSRLSNGVDTTFATENAFLKIITQGKNVTLYTYNDNKLILFVGPGIATPTPLTRYIYINDDNKEVNVDIYKQQLEKLATTYQPANTRLKRDVAASGYFLNDIKKYILVINDLTEEKNVAAPASAGESGHRFFIGAGVNISAVDYTFGLTVFPKQVYKANVTSIFPQINIGYDQIFNKNIGKWLLRTELSFTGSKVDMTLDKHETDDFIKTLKYDQYLLSLSPQIIFNVYNTNKFKLFLDGGATVNLNKISNKHYLLTLYNSYNKAEFIKGELQFPETESLFFSLIGKVGMVINNRIEIYAGAAPNVLLTKGNSDLKVTSYKAGINFLFGKK